MTLTTACLMIAFAMIMITVIVARNINFIAKQNKNRKKQAWLVICLSSLVGAFSIAAGIIFYYSGNAFIT